MGVGGVHPVGVHVDEVLDLELQERSGELLGIAEILGKCVRLELELAAEHITEQRCYEIHGNKSVKSENVAADDGMLSEEAKGRIQRVIVDEGRKKKESQEGMSLEQRMLAWIAFGQLMGIYLLEKHQDPTQYGGASNDPAHAREQR